MNGECVCGGGAGGLYPVACMAVVVWGWGKGSAALFRPRGSRDTFCVLLLRSRAMSENAYSLMIGNWPQGRL